MADHAVTTTATPGTTAAGRTAALAATLGLAAAAWVVTVWQMRGMDMGAATRLGSFTFFIAVWVAMMAAMMLPGAAPAVLRRADATGITSGSATARSSRPEAAAAQSRRRYTAGAGHHGVWHLDHPGARLGSRADAVHVRQAKETSQ
jgi:predicted metal-binding membrane protein